MTPDNPLLQAVLAEPDDDTLRLAVADWFDENGQATRAEFVRVQVELARGVPDPARRRGLEVRQARLLITHDAEWVAPLAKVLGCRPGQWGGWVFRRGFAEYFHLPATVVNKHGHSLAALTPVRELFLRPCDSRNVVALCRKPWLASVTHLYLEGVTLTLPACDAMVDSPYLTGLRVLRFTGAAYGRGGAMHFRARFAAARDAARRRASS